MAKRILCFGDSNTWGANPLDGSRFDETQRWTGLLQKKLGGAYLVIEEGQNGRTCEMDDPVEGEKSGLNYIVPCIESQLPLDLIVIMLGTNDMKLRFERGPAEIAAGLEHLVEKACDFLDGKGVSPQFLIVSPVHLHENIVTSDFSEMFGGLAGLKKSRALAPHFKQVAEKWNGHFVDAAAAAEASAVDALHLDEAGHLRLAELFYRTILKITG